MIYLIGKDEIFRNIAVLGVSYSKILPKTINELEFNFHNFLKDFQPSCPRSNETGAQIVENYEIEETLTNLYRTDALLNDRNQSAIIGDRFNNNIFHSQKKLLNEALENIKLNFPDVYEILQLTIDSFLLRNSKTSGGGSTSNAIGVIWINARSHWKLTDISELLIHELVHNLIFIDELRYLHFKDYAEILKEENFAQSAILKIKRPIDKVFHSIIVGVEILLARKNFSNNLKDPAIHPPSDKLHAQVAIALKSLFSLSNYDNLLTERGKYLMEKCNSYLDSMDLNGI